MHDDDFPQETNSFSDLDYYFTDVSYDHFQARAVERIRMYEHASERAKPFCKSERVKMLVPKDTRLQVKKDAEPFLVNPHAILGQVNDFYDDYRMEMEEAGLEKDDIKAMKKYDLDFLMQIYKHHNPNYDQEMRAAARKHRQKTQD